MLLSVFAKAVTLFKNRTSSAILNKLGNIFAACNILPAYPFFLMVEPVSLCNLHCPACPMGSGKLNRRQTTMSLVQFKRIVDQVKGYVKIISLWNFGEPFLNKELVGMIEYAVSSGIYVITSTNGGFLDDKELCLELVKSRLNHIVVSLDGVDQETNNKFRVGSDFNKIVKGLKLLQDAKRRLNSKTPVVELQFILMNHNEQQKDNMKQLAKELGADIYCEKMLFLDSNAQDFKNLAERFLPKSPELTRYSLKDNGEYALKGNISRGCPNVYFSSVINSDGEVVPCCWDLYSEYVMGNAYEENLKDIWNSDKYKSFRNRLRKNKKGISICNICPNGRHMPKKTLVLR